ncbi:MAG: PPOX class F420-dependent oxidoreductase [Acidimicrobiia bacterium]
MRNMAEKEIRRFLMSGTRTGKLATTRADGWPHVAPVWFVLDGDDLVFTTYEDTVKAHNLTRDGRAAMSVDDQTPPYSFVVVEGTVTISDDLEELRRWATRIGARYMGHDQAEAFGRRNAVPGELLVRLSPDRTIARADMAE